MGILIDDKKMRVHLYTDNTSYVIETLQGELIHSYWGKRIELPEHSPLVPIEECPSFYPNPNVEDKTYSLDVIPREYPDFGRSDYRSPGYRVEVSDGTKITDFVVQSFLKSEGKPDIPGLPSTYVQEGDRVHTLQVTLKDAKTNLELNLFYCVNETYDVITRHAVFKNE